MYFKIESRQYRYLGDNMCMVYATLNVYTEEGRIVATTKLTSSKDITATSFVSDIQTDISSKATEYLQKLIELDTYRLQHLPGSIDFADAINMILSPIEGGLNV
jgi:hypothetical protein